MSLVPWMYFQCCSCTLLNFAEVPISVMASTQVVKILLVIVNTFQSDDERIRSWKFWEISTQVLVTDTASTQVVKKVLIVAHTFQSDEKRNYFIKNLRNFPSKSNHTLSSFDCLTSSISIFCICWCCNRIYDTFIKWPKQDL